jgi:protease-4
MSPGLPWRGRIAVVELFGVLAGSYRTTRYLEILDALRRSRRTKAVVVNLDSPGGSAPAAYSLFLELSRLATEKPVVVFISGSGTSGAYLVSCAATRVVALPSAVVGSIGVISVRPLLPELLQKVGVQITVTKSGEFKDMGAIYRFPTPEEQQKEQELVQRLYEDFVSTVARSRRLEPDVVRRYATGEIFLAPQAKELGLIDEVGDWDRAVDLAMELGKVPRRLYHARPHRALAERLLSRFAFSMVEEISEQVERYLLGHFYFLSQR